MPCGQFLNSKKFGFSHQVALVGINHVIFKSLTLFAMTICINRHITSIIIIAHT